MSNLSSKELNIIMGFQVENRSCRKIKQFFSEEMQKYLSPGYTVNVVNLTTDRMIFDDSVRGGMYNVGFVLEVMNGTPIGQGGIKAWRRDNPDMRIILVMEESRRSTGKAKGLFDIGYYDGIFLGESVSNELLVSLLENGRTKEEAFEYYGLADYKEPEKKSKPVKEVEPVRELPKNVGQLNISGSTNTVVDTQPFIGKDNAGEQFQGMSFGMGVVDFGKKKSDALSASLSFSHVENELTEEEPLIVNVPSAGTQPDIMKDGPNDFIENDYTAREIESGIEETVNETTSDEQNYNESAFSYGAFDAEEEESENNGVLSFSDSSTSEMQEPVDDDRNRHDVVVENRTYARKTLDEILSSKESISKYFANRTSEAYPASSKEEKEMSVIDQMFVECYEPFVKLYDIYFKEAVTGAASSNRLSEKLFDAIENLSAAPDTKEAISDMFLKYTYGYDILEGLLASNDISEIHVLSRDSVRVKKGSKRYSTELVFYGRGRYEGFCEQLLIRNQDNLTSDGIVRTFTDSTFSDKYYLQVSIRSAEYTTTNEPELHIRKTPKSKRTLKSLCSHKKILKEHAGYLTYAVLEEKGILICGSPTSGKTTLLNALMDYIPSEKSAIALQHRDELVPGVHPEVSVIHPRVKADGLPGASIVELAKDALGEDAEYFIMGDIKGPEAEPCYQALLSSYIVWTCISCAKPEDALIQFAKYIQFSGNKSSFDEIMYMLCNKVGTIVFMDNLSVANVYRVEEYDAEKGVILKNINELFSWQKKGENKGHE